MELETLEIFAELMRTRNFSDVSRGRGVAPSSVSRTIAGLEKELGIRLFQRSTRKLEPTEAGVTYFERIEPLLTELRAAHAIARDVSAEPKGVLRVTAGVVYGEMYIVPLLPELFRRYPSLKVELMLTDASLDLIEERIDVAVRTGTLSNSSYIARRLSMMKFVLCASPEYVNKNGVPEEPQQLRNHNCLLFPRSGYSTHKWLLKNASGKVTEVAIEGNCLITNSKGIVKCAVDGMGVALLPDWLVGQEIQQGDLVRLLEPYEASPTDFDGAVWLLTPSREYMPVKTRIFVDFLVATFSGRMGQ